MLAAALIPMVILSLGAADVMQESRAIWAALGVGLLTLGIQGAAICARRAERTATVAVRAR